MTPITYIGKRETYRDRLYGTNLEFTQGQTHPVPDATARLMLRHPDQYELGQGDFPPDETVPEAKGADDDQDTQNARDSVARMDKEAVTRFIKTNFGADVDKRLGVDSLRQKAVRLIDQYGMPG